MTTRDEKIVGWLIPALMTATLGLVGWIGITINRISETLAVVAYRVDSTAVAVKDLGLRVGSLELFAERNKRKYFESRP